MLAYPAQHVREFAVNDHDAIYIWVPKAVRALDEAPPDLAAEAEHFHPEYPRGLGILTGALAAPVGLVDPRLPRAVTLLLFALMLLCVYDTLSCRDNAAGAVAAMVVLGSIPMVLRWAPSGLADLPLAGFVLLATIGLAPGRGGLPAAPLALAGALGALVVKDEGLVFFALATAILAAQELRARRPGAALASVAVAALLAVPWVVLRSRPLTGSPVLWKSTFENLGLTILRADRTVQELLHYALGFPDPSPGGYALPDAVPGGDLLLHVAIVCGLVLMIGRGGRIPVLPAALLLLVDFVVIVMSHVMIDWQLVTALHRLVSQCLPVLLVAAIDKLTMPDAAAAAASARTPAPA
jgi:hypothetical protein